MVDVVLWEYPEAINFSNLSVRFWHANLWVELVVAGTGTCIVRGSGLGWRQAALVVDRAHDETRE